MLPRAIFRFSGVEFSPQRTQREPGSLCLFQREQLCWSGFSLGIFWKGGPRIRLLRGFATRVQRFFFRGGDLGCLCFCGLRSRFFLGGGARGGFLLGGLFLVEL